MHALGTGILMVSDVVDRWSAHAAAPLPDEFGRFGRFGGKYAPETLMPALDELEAAYRDAVNDIAFHMEIERLAKDYVGRPTPLYEAERLSEHAGGARIFLKRED